MNRILLSLCFLLSINVIAQEVTSLTLIDANSNAAIRELVAQDTIYLDDTGSELNIRANASGTVGSIRFGYDGNTNQQTESTAPYAFAGDNSGDYTSWTPSEGTHTVTATPYSAASAEGTAGTMYSVKLVVIAEGSVPQGGLEPSSEPGTGLAELSGELMKWHKITLSFDGPAHKERDTQANPFLDYRLNVKFSNGTKSYVVPGYFAADGNAAETSADSGNVWRVHFTPDAIGEWKWSASFRFGEDVAVSLEPMGGEALAPLDGQSGLFTVLASDKTGLDLRAKGRLSYVGEHYLRFEETGEYFLKGGADAPENLLAYEDFDNTPNNGNRLKSYAPHRDDWETGDPTWQSGKGTELIGAINYLASEGLNVFSFLSMNINGDDKNVYPYVSASDFKHLDCSKLDQWGIVFDHGMTKGMYLHFKTQETENETLLNDGNLGTNRKLYYRELVARYAYHLALNWNLGEENADQSTSQRQDMAQYFYDIDPYHHNIVLHTYPNAQESVYLPLIGQKSKLTGVSIQKAWNAVHTETKQWVAQSAANGKKWVVANDEQGGPDIGVPDDAYTGSPSIHDIRKQTLWGNIMAGGAGVEYYFGYQRPQSDLNCEDFRSRDMSWDYVRYALEFFKQYTVPFSQMSIADNLVEDGWCLADTGNVYLVYLPGGGSTYLNLEDSNTYAVSWYDPRNGGELKDGSLTEISGAGKKHLGTAPDNSGSDWLILIRNTEGVNRAPLAVAVADTLLGEAPQEIAFDASGSADSDGSIVSWEWDFGNGTFDFGEQVSHIFDGGGEFLVKLTVNDDKGRTSNDVLFVKINGEAGGGNCDGEYTEVDGLAVVEIESEDPAGGWKLETEVVGYTGGGYFRWDGPDSFGNPGNGTVSYQITITNPGTYRFQWHNKIMHGTNATESNDSWLRIPDADDFFAKKNNVVKYPKGGMFVQSNTVAEGASGNGWMKVFSSGTTNWTWRSVTSDNEGFPIFATFNEAGTYTVQISGRSKNHALDRFVLYDQSKLSEAEATSLANEQTACGLSQALPEYTVVFTVDDGRDAIPSASVVFNGKTRTTDAEGKAEFTGVNTVTDATYKVVSDCFEAVSGTLDVRGDVHFSISMDSTACKPDPEDEYEVKVKILDRSTGDPVPRAQVWFGENQKPTSIPGEVVFYFEKDSQWDYRVEHSDYFDASGSIDVTADTSFLIELTARQAKVIFLVEADDEALQNSTVSMADLLYTTSTNGKAIYYNLPSQTEYIYEIVHSDYETLLDTLFLDIDTTVTVNLIPLSGIGSARSGDFRIYPNPSTGKVTLETNSRDAIIWVMGPEGRILQELKADTDKTVLNLGAFPEGYYLIQVQTEHSRIVKRVVRY
jgi:hypothetical protein